jgi:UDP-N-acetylmuramoyl-L-alanyl-D-glutamate--2,6-diaminopimelate ligase
MMKLEQLLENVAVESVRGSVDLSITGIAHDSRQVKEGGLFVAVPGENVDGAEFIAEALSSGAVAVVSQNDLGFGPHATHVQVEDARRALAELASAFYGDLSHKMKIVGVTGTNGKTTTTFMIRDVLRAGGFLPGLLGTVAYEVGGRTIPASRTTPEAPDIHAMLQQMYESACDAAVMEVSSHAIDLNRVHKINFAACVFTNLTQDHLDYHKNMETYFAAKARLFRELDEQDERTAIVNIDDAWGRRLLEEENARAAIITYGFDARADVRACNEKLTEKGSRFQVETPWGKAKVRLQLLGRFNIHNALAAIATGGQLGVDLPVMAEALGRIQSIPGRLEFVPNRSQKQVVVDYAHTDDALRNVLETLRECCRGKLVVVFGCGGDRDRGKRAMMGCVAAQLADFSIVTTDNPRKEEPSQIIGDIIEGFNDQKQYEVVLDRRAAIEKGLKTVGRRDILLIAGKGHETYQELKETVVPFDDREVVREILG